MLRLFRSTRFLSVLAIALIFGLLLPMALSASPVQAKAGDEVYRGIISSKPTSGNIGTWVIAGKNFSATRSTQFDVVDGPLVVGGCAKVKIRNGAVKEIDSEPAGDCR